jgi:heme-degrading monooxygenase HmoA
MLQFHLAQFNIGRIVAPMDSPTMAGFVARLEEINALAEGTPGFVWRLQTEDGDATALRPYDDDRIIVNMSVWASMDALRGFVYQGSHAEVLRQRREWFEKMDQLYMVMWWVPAGHIPTVEEAKARLERLKAEGPSPAAFTWRNPFPAPDEAGRRVEGFPTECPA